MTLAPLLGYELLQHPRLVRSLIARWKNAEYLGEEGVIRQEGPSDCGVACLQMVFKRKGISATASAIRSSSGTTGRGTSILGLKRAAERFGLKAAAWRLRDEDLPQAPLPLIAFVDQSHFVIISEITIDHHLIVLDPAAGKLRSSLKSFKNRWHGEVIIFSDIKTKF